jgi:hypothetical protein
MTGPGTLRPTAVLAVAAAAEIAVLSSPRDALGRAAVLLFLLVGPGAALVPLLRLDDGMGELLLMVALSVVLDLLVATTLVLTRAWSPTAAMGVLLTVAAGGAIAQVVRAGRAP